MKGKVTIVNNNINRLFDVIIDLNNLDECSSFFYTLCTDKEIKTLAQRLAIAERILHGYTYSSIEKELLTSTLTISRVKRTIEYGDKTFVNFLNRINNSI
ncbi:YerC/YecD family TrpR-related protein [Staphylococcus pasteuri]|uniref:YerC/YecD family TrpR-related protein n=1 Tax=Staphylococcus pasteuri TaxID=45972 RepID=UPI0021BF1AB5|nr:YerC/YecD family TrpR-related protein [Staphylococcus pasteuri]